MSPPDKRVAPIKDPAERGAIPTGTLDFLNNYVGTSPNVSDCFIQETIVEWY